MGFAFLCKMIKTRNYFTVEIYFSFKWIRNEDDDFDLGVKIENQVCYHFKNNIT